VSPQKWPKSSSEASDVGQTLRQEAKDGRVRDEDFLHPRTDPGERRITHRAPPSASGVETVTGQWVQCLIGSNKQSTRRTKRAQPGQFCFWLRCQSVFASHSGHSTTSLSLEPAARASVASPAFKNYQHNSKTSASDRENPVSDLIHGTRLPGGAVHTNRSRYPLAFHDVSDQPLSSCRCVHRKKDGVEALF
jgi:hypothetical protein